MYLTNYHYLLLIPQEQYMLTHLLEHFIICRQNPSADKCIPLLEYWSASQIAYLGDQTRISLISSFFLNTSLSTQLLLFQLIHCHQMSVGNWLQEPTDTKPGKYLDPLYKMSQYLCTTYIEPCTLNHLYF